MLEGSKKGSLKAIYSRIHLQHSHWIYMSAQWDSNSKDDRSSNYDYTSFLLKFQ